MKNNLNVEEIRIDIKKRMIAFDKIRINKKKDTLTNLDDLKKTLIEFYPIDDNVKNVKETTTKVSIENLKNESDNAKSNIKSNEKSEVLKPVKKENKGLFNVITDFFSDDPKGINAKNKNKQN